MHPAAMHILLQAGPDADMALSWIERLGVLGVVLVVVFLMVSGKLRLEREFTRLEAELTKERAGHESTRQELRGCQQQEQQRAQGWQRIAEDARAELERANTLLGLRQDQVRKRP